MTKVVILISLLYIFGLNANPWWNHGNKFQYITKQMEKLAIGPELTETKWIQQPVDHFNNEDKRTWKMRYCENTQFFKPNGPIFIFIGGEGEMLEIFSSLYMYKMAQETNGAMFGTEHRYYGQSIPLSNMSEVSNMKYLSTEQALADLVYFIEWIKASPDYKQSKVVVIGGSYAGNLAAWMRLKYPDIVDAAWSSSAPVLAKKDFFEYIEKVAEDYHTYGGDKCYDKIVKIFKRYENLLQTSEGIAQLKREKGICETTDLTKPLNKALFFFDEILPFIVNAQYHKPRDILSHCSRLTNKFEDTTEKGIKQFARNISNDINYKITKYPSNVTENINCTDYEYTDYKPEESWVWSWVYQTCTEFGYYQTTNSNNQPFTKNLILDLYVKLCSMWYGPEFDESRIDQGIAHINKQYGGLTPHITKVVFVNGGMDPWSKLGILKDLSVDALARVVPDSSHCKDIFRDNIDDSKEIIETREFVKSMLNKWLGI